MKNYNDITHINYNDLAFIQGITPADAKWEIALKLWALKDVPTTAKGAPKVKVTDAAPVDKFDFTMRSNSHLDGQDKLKYMVDYYNKGCDVNTLRAYGENKTFIKKLKFTGKHSILNDILNPDQLRKLQQIWLFSNVYGKTKFSDEAIKFISKHKWSEEYLESKGIKLKLEAI